MSLQSKENSQQNRETTYKKIEEQKNSLQENSQQNRETTYKKTVNRTETTYKKIVNRTETTYKKTISRIEKQHTGKQLAEQRNNLQNKRKFLETIWHKSDIQNV